MQSITTRTGDSTFPLRHRKEKNYANLCRGSILRRTVCGLLLWTKSLRALSLLMDVLPKPKERGFGGSLSIQQGSKLVGTGAVDPAYQGLGLGKILVRKAVEFCRSAGHKRIYLWTFQGLETARRIYELEGFSLTEEREVDQWGGILREQRFDLVL